MFAPRQADQLNQLRHPGGDFCFRHARDLHREGDVFIYRTRPEQVEVLEDHADLQPRLAQALTARGGDILTVDGHATLGGLLQAIEQADQSTFPRAAVADDAVNLPLLNRQVHIIHGGNRYLSVVKNLRDIPQDDHFVGVSVMAV